MPGGTFPVNVMIYTIKKSKSLDNKYKKRGCQGASLLLLVIASPWSVLVKLGTTYLFSFHMLSENGDINFSRPKCGVCSRATLI